MIAPCFPNGAQEREDFFEESAASGDYLESGNTF
jgi:hypothetical protein